MQPWFQEAKLGIIIHWGIYAVQGISESWSFYNREIDYDTYMAQIAGFTAERYDPEQWADLFLRAGARYAILTTKHHDGVALFDTALSKLSTTKPAPAERDLVGPYAAAMREKGIRVGFYFSHLDWSHPDYASLAWFGPDGEQDLTTNPYSYSHSGDDLERWGRFLIFHRGQLRELMTNYGQVDLLWFDGEWERSAEQWQMGELRDNLHGYHPEVILNSRMYGHGDYETPEQGLPIQAPDGPWELCMTINDSWGYQPDDHHYKSVRQIVTTFAECIGKGGNLLLGVGPLADGTFDPRQEHVLEELGAWIHKHEEAVYSTERGLPPGYVYGATTLSKDKTLLYVFLFDRPWESFAIKGILNGIVDVEVVGRGTRLKHEVVGGAPWLGVPGTLWVNLPEVELDPLTTVIRIRLDSPLELYFGKGKVITSN
ncbi:MAG: alpha-L-fucosidase [Gorillibacterium sp.]|nr:alpha-L-fucosidase [Gorillibacterium sp.]